MRLKCERGRRDLTAISVPSFALRELSQTKSRTVMKSSHHPVTLKADGKEYF